MSRNHQEVPVQYYGAHFFAMQKSLYEFGFQKNITNKKGVVIAEITNEKQVLPRHNFCNHCKTTFKNVQGLASHSSNSKCGKKQQLVPEKKIGAISEKSKSSVIDLDFFQKRKDSSVFKGTPVSLVDDYQSSDKDDDDDDKNTEKTSEAEFEDIDEPQNYAKTSHRKDRRSGSSHRKSVSLV
jgi:hypothetical protein